MNSSETLKHDLKCEIHDKNINNYVDEGIINMYIKSTLAKSYRVLPLFEKCLADHSFKKSKSFLNNDFMERRWREYKNKAATAIHVPFQFPQPSDYHFYNNKMCYKPSESIRNRIDNRLHLVPGPGVDVFGEIPIPNELRFR